MIWLSCWSWRSARFWLAVNLLGALVLNMVLAVNHKPGRYNGY